MKYEQVKYPKGTKNMEKNETLQSLSKWLMLQNMMWFTLHR
jgi:hypothetical protein